MQQYAPKALIEQITVDNLERAMEVGQHRQNLHALTFQIMVHIL